MPQPQSGQQSGFADMQLWQQQLMLKQLQELQRQKQIQQLNQEAKRHNQINELSAIARQTNLDQLPTLVNGMPLHDTSNFLWQNELVGGNMAWAQRGGSPAIHGLSNGLPFSHEQGQDLRSMGLASLQHDQSLYGAPVASTRSNLNQYSHIQGISQDYSDILTKANGNPLERPALSASVINNSFQADQPALYPNQISMQDGASVSRQVFQGSFFGNSTLPGMNSGVQLGNLHQFSALPSNALAQEFQSRQQQQAGWSGHVQEKSTSQVSPSQGAVSLDPTEKKILFSTDDDLWDGSMGRGGMTGAIGFGNALEGMDHLSGFATLQSGTWSALMQSAVAEASSSDTGMQDEWSGLSFQKTELSSGNQPGTLSDSAKQPADWANNNLQTASSLTSRPFPLFDDIKANLSGGSSSDLRQSGIKSSYEQSSRMQADVSHESNQSSKKSSRWMGGHQQKLVGGSHQVQPTTHLGNSSQSDFLRHGYELSANAAPSSDMESNAQNLQGSWMHRQSIPSYSIETHPSNRPTGWNINEAVSPGGDVALGIGEIRNSCQRSQSNDVIGGMQIERECDGGSWKADDNCSANTLPNLTGGLEQVRSGVGHQVNREGLSMTNFTAVANSSTMKTAQEASHQVVNNHQPEYGKRAIDSSLKYKGEENAGKYQNQLGPPLDESPGHNSDRESGGGLRENSWLNSSESRPLSSVSQKSAVQAGRKASASRRFQYHPMGNLEVHLEPADNSKRTAHPQVPSQPASQVTRNHEQDYFGHPKFVGHASDSAIEMEKGHLPDFPRNAKATSSFDGSTGHYAQNKRNAQTCQNMLELFHKVDQPREQRTSQHFSSSDHNLQHESSEPETSDASVSQQWRNQSVASQGFGLRLAPPSQRLPASNIAISTQNSSHTVNGPNSRHADGSGGDKSQTWMTPTSNAHALSSHETSSKELLNNRANISGQIGSKSPQSSVHVNSSGTFTLPYSRDQARQLLPSFSGQVTSNHSAISSSDGLASHLRVVPDAYKAVLADQSALGSLPGSASRIAPFNVTQSVAASKPLNNNLPYGRIPSEHLPILESVPISQSSISGKSQQGAFSSILHNVWTNVSTQQHRTDGLQQKIPANLLHSLNPSNSNSEKALMDTSKPPQGTRKGGSGPDFGACSITSEQLAYGEEHSGIESYRQHMPAEKVNPSAIQGHESLVKHPQDAKSDVSGSLIVPPHQEFDRGRYGKDPVLVSQSDNAPQRGSSATSAGRDIDALGRSLKQQSMHHNYSLLHQVQAFKAVEADPNMRSGKRFKATDSGSVAQQFAAKSGSQSLDGYSIVIRDVDEQDAAAQRPTGDSRMLSFSSEGRDDHSTGTPSNLGHGGLPSQDVVSFGRNESHNHSSHPSGTARSESSQISPQMAPSWFEQYGSFKNGQILPIYDTSRTAKPALHQLLYYKMPENVHAHPAVQQQVSIVGASHGGVCITTVSAFGASEQASPAHFLPSEAADKSLALTRPRKRKTETSGLLPWHKEIICGSERLQSVSMAEQDWAQAANRLIAKVEDEAEMDDGLLPIRPRRRLIFTTQLMHQLFHPPPASILSADANSNYEMVTYYIAKLALGEACGLMSSSRSESCSSAPNENMIPGSKTSDRVSDQYFAKVVEDFIGRAMKLEANLVRLDRRASLLDIKVECQDLERFSIINRFASFHGRPQADVAHTSSDAASNTQKTCQRYVTANPIPRSLPEGVQCLSL
ncbi:hypothetical protein Syun_023305 [Stephania yunnanensis]|uniref:Uncharacterized protein n=1 Tax=Stephania yunnanensis TaxID=152371 RepID=A0AAP0I3Q7_9MAGN